MRRPLPFISLILLGVAVDQITKWYVFRWLDPIEPNAYVVIDGVLNFRLAENKGVAFSMLANRSLVIFAISLVAIGAMIWIYVANLAKGSGTLFLALGLLMIGALGNLIDRLALNHVRDFIEFVPEIPLVGHWAIFNVADICITIGVFIFLYAELFQRPPEPDGAPAKSQSAQPPQSSGDVQRTKQDLEPSSQATENTSLQ